MDKELEILIREFRETYKKISNVEIADEEDVYQYNELLTRIEERILKMQFDDEGI